MYSQVPAVNLPGCFNLLFFTRFTTERAPELRPTWRCPQAESGAAGTRFHAMGVCGAKAAQSKSRQVKSKETQGRLTLGKSRCNFFGKLTETCRVFVEGRVIIW